jgi:hypothetical protein
MASFLSYLFFSTTFINGVIPTLHIVQTCTDSLPSSISQTEQSQQIETNQKKFEAIPSWCHKTLELFFCCYPKNKAKSSLTHPNRPQQTMSDFIAQYCLQANRICSTSHALLLKAEWLLIQDTLASPEELAQILKDIIFTKERIYLFLDSLKTLHSSSKQGTLLIDCGVKKAMVQTYKDLTTAFDKLQSTNPNLTQSEELSKETLDKALPRRASFNHYPKTSQPRP